MAEVLTPVDDLFSSEEFSAFFTEWQRAALVSDKRVEQLGDHLAKGYEGDPTITKDDIDDKVSGYLEYSDESFQLIFGDDETALRLKELRALADNQQTEAKETLMDFSKDYGVSQFALYGLWLHMRESGIIPKTELKAKVLETETDFDPINKLVRNNPGELLTVISHGIQAGRLGAGEISLNGDYGKIIIPQAEGTKSYSMSLLKEISKVYTSDYIQIDAADVHSIIKGHKTKIHDSWSDFLNISSNHDIGTTTVLATGNIAEGPPFIPQEKDRDFFQMAFDRIRTVGKAALST